MFWTPVYQLDEGYYNFSELDIDANGMKSVGITPFPLDSDLQGFAAGYISLRVPVVRESKPPFGIVPQSEQPVRVLLTAFQEDSHRGKVAQDQENDITYSYSNPQLASGTAYNEIPPDTSLFVNPKFVSKYAHEILSRTGTSKAITPIPPKRDGALNLHEQDAAQALIDLLGELGDDKAEIEALNKALQARRSSVSVRLNRS